MDQRGIKDRDCLRGDDQQIHPVLAVLAGVERPVRSDPVDSDHGTVDNQLGVPGLPGLIQRLTQLTYRSGIADRSHQSGRNGTPTPPFGPGLGTRYLRRPT